MKYIILLWLFPILTSCNDRNTIIHKNDVKNKIPISINIEDAIMNPIDEILLSELADSISYIPLETKKECILGDYPFFSFTSHYITYCNYCFNWSGKFMFKVGRLGQGPGEEPSEIITKITYCENNFYTCAQKIIEYDSIGSFTGKELSLYSIDKSKGIISPKNLFRIEAMNSTKGKLLIYNYPDTLFIMNKNFDFLAKHSIMPWKKKSSPYFLTLNSPYDRYMTIYNETILLYNYFRDTVFQISGTDFQPRWIIKLNKLKLTDEVLYNFDELYKQGFKDYKKKQLASTPLAKLMDHKYMITSVHESNNYVFITASEIIFLRGLRNIPKSSPLLIYYNKKTKEIKSTKKIIDDLSNYTDFFPRLGIVDEKMIDFFWPYEQEEWLKEKAKNDPRFSSFSGRDFSEDNPIIMVVHLKK